MSHKILRRCIVKVSVLGVHFPLLELNFTIRVSNNMLT